MAQQGDGGSWKTPSVTPNKRRPSWVQDDALIETRNPAFPHNTDGLPSGGNRLVQELSEKKRLKRERAELEEAERHNKALEAQVARARAAQAGGVPPRR